MKNTRRIWILFPMFCGFNGTLAAQAMIERGLITSHSTVGAASARGVKKSVSGVMGSLDKLVKNGSDGATAAGRHAGDAQVAEPESASVETAPHVPAAPAKVYEDPLGIRTGMANEELIRRFGPPSLEVVGASSGRLLTYSGKNGIIQLELRNDKVALMSAMNPRQAAVVLPGQSLGIH